MFGNLHRKRVCLDQPQKYLSLKEELIKSHYVTYTPHWLYNIVKIKCFQCLIVAMNHYCLSANRCHHCCFLLTRLRTHLNHNKLFSHLHINCDTKISLTTYVMTEAVA